MFGHTFHQNVQVKAVKIPAACASETLPATYIDMAGWDRAVLLLECGILASGDTVNVQAVQATSSAGAGSKNLTGATFSATFADADDSKWGSIEIPAEAFDVAGGFRFLSFTFTKAGATFYVAAQCLLFRGGGLSPAQDAAYKEAVVLTT